MTQCSHVDFNHSGAGLDGATWRPVGCTHEKIISTTSYLLCGVLKIAEKVFANEVGAIYQ